MTPPSSKNSPVSSKPQSAQPHQTTERQTGIIRLNPRGFGFATHPDGEDRFVPAAATKGLLDGDEITYRSHNTEAKDIRFHKRLRKVVFCDVTAQSMLRVDPLLGDLTLRSPRKLALNSCALVQLEPLTIIETFKDPQSEEALLARLFSRHEIPVELPKAATQERVKPSRIQRRDLRNLLTITIDDDSSEDLDDALSCELAPNGDLRVFVHIADVASVVLPNSQIDKAAATVPTSVYLPGHTRHMLPRQLAADALSLIPHVDRGALTVEMLITQEGIQRSMEIYPSLINSNERLSYVTAGKLIQGAAHDDADVAELVRVLHTAASRISIQRRARGGVDAWRVDVTELNMTSHSEDQAHELIERLMVQTNEAVAHFLHDRAMPAVFRSHPELTQDNVDELQEALPDAHIAFPLTPRAFSALAARFSHTQSESAFWDAALSVMPKARYQLAPLGHFGLGSDLYAHFTSPLRRYADLLTHRVLHEWFKGHRAVDEIPMHQAVITINSVSRRAEMVERDARRLQALLVLDSTQTYEVVVTGSTKRDARVRFVGLDLQAFIPHASHLRPGFRTQVRITALDPLAQKLELEMSNNKRSSNKRQLKPTAQAAADPAPVEPSASKPSSKSSRSSRVTPKSTKALLEQAAPAGARSKRPSKPASTSSAPAPAKAAQPKSKPASEASTKTPRKRSNRRKKAES